MSYLSNYYQNDLKKLLKKVIPKSSTYIKIKNELKVKRKYDYIILANTLADLDDIQSFLNKLKRNCKPQTRIVVIYFNFFWRPILNIANSIWIRKKHGNEPNWLAPDDIENLFRLEGFTKIKSEQRFIPFLANTLSQLPIINNLCLTTCQIFTPSPQSRDYSVSIVITAKNESGNIRRILKKIPILRTGTEVIFVEGNSKDNTFEEIKKEITNYKGKLKCSLYKQTGKGKGDAVRLGFDKANNEILMI